MINKFIVDGHIFNHIPESICPYCKTSSEYKLKSPDRKLKKYTITCVGCFRIIEDGKVYWKSNFIIKLRESYKKACIKREMLDKIKKL